MPRDLCSGLCLGCVGTCHHTHCCTHRPGRMLYVLEEAKNMLFSCTIPHPSRRSSRAGWTRDSLLDSERGMPIPRIPGDGCRAICAASLHRVGLLLTVSWERACDPEAALRPLLSTIGASSFAHQDRNSWQKRLAKSHLFLGKKFSHPRPKRGAVTCRSRCSRAL